MAKELTTTEAGARLGLDPITIRRQIGAGKLAATKRGRDWFITERALADYEREHKGRHGWAKRPKTAKLEGGQR